MSRDQAREAEAVANGGEPAHDLEAIERKRLDELARAHSALAEAQDRSYWLDRWGIDLNALMRRRGASELRAALRALRAARRFAAKARSQAARRVAEERSGVAAERTRRAAAQPAGRFHRSFSPKPLEAAPASALLFERLDHADVEAIEARLDATDRARVAGAGPLDRPRLLLNLGIHHDVPGIAEKTGLSSVAPPEDVHSMARGSLAAGGSLYYGDLIADALARAGVELAGGTRCLDFGCSSGRIVRVLAAAHPDCVWHGCDPIGAAVAWARDHLPSIEFVHSPERPPLPYDDGSLDVAFAVSIWSHFAEPDALAWLAEMHRILRPGGTLLLTTHGYQTLAHDEVEVRGADQLAEIQRALYDDAFWFKNEFGDGGDHGVENSGWGTAFLTPEWLLWAAAGDWRVVDFGPGRVESNQDLYVLERR